MHIFYNFYFFIKESNFASNIIRLELNSIKSTLFLDKFKDFLRKNL